MTSWIVAALRRLRDERLSAFGLAILVLVTAFVAAAAPRLHDRVADDTLTGSIAEAAPQDRHVQLLSEGRQDGTIAEPFVGIDRLAESLRARLPASIAGLVVDEAWTVESNRWHLPQGEPDTSTMRLRIQPDVTERAHLTAGRWPTGATREVLDEATGAFPAPRLTAFEVALPKRTAELIRAEVGEVMTLISDETDQMVGRGHEMLMAVEIVGIFELDDPADPWWLGGFELIQPIRRWPIPDFQINDTTALLSPDAYLPYLRETSVLRLPLRYTFREYIDPARIGAEGVADVLVDLRRLEAEIPATNPTFSQPTALRTGLRALLERHLERWASASAILTVGAVGPAAVAAGALGLVAVLAAARRRSALALSRGRGASIGQVVVAVVAEGLLLAGPAAALAVVAAIALVPADGTGLSVAAGGAIGVVAVVLLVTATVPATGGHSFGPARDAFVPRRTSPRRLVFEGLIVAAALGGALLLRERGLRGTSSAGEISQADPLLAAVPALVGLASGLAAIRLVPPAMRLLAALARRGRGLVGVLAMRRATHGQGTAAVLLVLLATAAIGAFSSAILVHIDRSADTVAWQEIGADHRIDSGAGSIPRGFDATTIPGVEAAAGAWSEVQGVGPRNLRVEFLALDVAAYEAVTAGTPAAPRLPVDLFAADQPVIPVVVSRAVASRPDGLAVGFETPITLQANTFRIRVVAVHDDLPALTGGQPLWVLASRQQIQELASAAPLSPSTLYVRAPGVAPDAFREAVLEREPAGLSVRSRTVLTDDIRTSPISRAVVVGIAAAALVAVAYATIAVAAALALAGSARALEVAHLRTLGLTGRQAAALVVAEHGPAVALALGLGAALGLATFSVLRQGLGLEALVGSSVEIAFSVDPLQLACVAGAIAVVVAGGLVLGMLLQRGAAPVAAVRRGFE